MCVARHTHTSHTCHTLPLYDVARDVHTAQNHPPVVLWSPDTRSTHPDRHKQGENPRPGHTPRDGDGERMPTRRVAAGEGRVKTLVTQLMSDAGTASPEAGR